MNLDRLFKMTYIELVAYLNGLHGFVQEPYFTDETCTVRNVRNSRTGEGLNIHHVGEYLFNNLCNTGNAVKVDFTWQLPQQLCYATLLEHLLLHIKILEESKQRRYIELGVRSIIDNINYYFVTRPTQGYEANIYYNLRTQFNDYIAILQYILNSDKKQLYMLAPYLSDSMSIPSIMVQNALLSNSNKDLMSLVVDYIDYISKGDTQPSKYELYIKTDNYGRYINPKKLYDTLYDIVGDVLLTQLNSFTHKLNTIDDKLHEILKLTVGNKDVAFNAIKLRNEFLSNNTNQLSILVKSLSSDRVLRFDYDYETLIKYKGDNKYSYTAKRIADTTIYILYITKE